MQVSPNDYDQMRQWLGRIAREVFPPELMSKGADPVAALDAIAATSPAKARQGLAMALGDIIELTSGWTTEQVDSLDRRLVDDGLPALTTVRARFSKAVQRIVRRGRINDEPEYYALRNAAEQGGDTERLRQMLATYESQAAN